MDAHGGWLATPADLVRWGVALDESARPALLKPATIQRILAGQQPRCMSLLWFQRNPLPLAWALQRQVVEGFDA